MDSSLLTINRAIVCDAFFPQANTPRGVGRGRLPSLGRWMLRGPIHCGSGLGVGFGPSSGWAVVLRACTHTALAIWVLGSAVTK